MRLSCGRVGRDYLQDIRRIVANGAARWARTGQKLHLRF